MLSLFTLRKEGGALISQVFKDTLTEKLVFGWMPESRECVRHVASGLRALQTKRTDPIRVLSQQPAQIVEGQKQVQRGWAW